MRVLCVFSSVLAVVAGCNSQAPEPKSEKPAPFVLTSFNLEEAPTVTLNVPDMHCQYSCAPKVFETLVVQPGVKDVKVELESKTATVAFDAEAFDAEATIAALADVQFTNTTLAQ
ncbi:MAG: heavy-metal-associated domain-containing protein [Pirellulales bacterium]|nr:heavy-metal-associated domain-containing protein [Pirellulales bacterium]